MSWLKKIGFSLTLLVLIWSASGAAVSFGNLNLTEVSPRVLTPNGDQLNDVFRPLPQNVNVTSMEIFDRWGERVYFEEAPKAIQWDGKFQLEDQEMEVFAVVIKGLNHCNVQVEYTGQVTLIR